MKYINIFLLGLGVILAVTASAVEPEGLAITCSVREHGAVGDGVTDDTAAIQRALDATGATGGGIVFLPTGNYFVESHLNIPSFVTLQGVWTAPVWGQMSGSTLLAVEGEGDENGPPFIMLQPNATLKGVTIFYPNQDPDDIKPYPWCIAGIRDNPSIIDVTMINPYLGVDFGTIRHPAGGVGRFFIRNLYGQPLRKGLYVNGCLDIGRIENVHFWPFWLPPGNTYTLENGEAFIFGKTDWQYCLNTFCYGYKVGYKFIQTPEGVCNGNFLGIGADGSQIAVLVEQCSPLAILITNGEFSSFGGPSPYEVVTGPDFTGSVQFQNCSFWGSVTNVGKLEGHGSVTFQTCNFVRWGYHQAPQPAIDCYGGRISVTGSRFRTTGPQIRFRPEVQLGLFSQNICWGPELVLNESLGQTLVESNVCNPYPDEEDAAIVVDNAMMKGSSDRGRFETEGDWKTYAGGKSYLGSSAWTSPGDGTDKARWIPNLNGSGKYEVFIWFGIEKKEASNAKNAPFTVHHSAGYWFNREPTTTTLNIDTTATTSQWLSIGTYYFTDKPENSFVEVNNNTDGRLLADAVKFVQQ